MSFNSSLLLLKINSIIFSSNTKLSIELYYAGYNKIIIEFENEKNSILIFDPINNNEKIFFITKKNSERDNKTLYKNVLKEFDPYLLRNKEYNIYIKTFDDFINNKGPSDLIQENVNIKSQGNYIEKGLVLNKIESNVETITEIENKTEPKKVDNYKDYIRNIDENN